MDKIVELLGAGELAKRWNVTRQRVAQWAKQGRIVPIARHGNSLFYAPDTERPAARNRWWNRSAEAEKDSQAIVRI